jgi:hypothetical protein
MYDEFGNLKKKFRAKAKNTESAQSLPGSGRAGGEVEQRGILLDIPHVPACFRIIYYPVCVFFGSVTSYCQV